MLIVTFMVMNIIILMIDTLLRYFKLDNMKYFLFMISYYFLRNTSFSIEIKWIFFSILTILLFIQFFLDFIRVDSIKMRKVNSYILVSSIFVTFAIVLINGWLKA